jgi:hypothetical protein
MQATEIGKITEEPTIHFSAKETGNTIEISRANPVSTFEGKHVEFTTAGAGMDIALGERSAGIEGHVTTGRETES